MIVIWLSYESLAQTLELNSALNTGIDGLDKSKLVCSAISLLAAAVVVYAAYYSLKNESHASIAKGSWKHACTACIAEITFGCSAVALQSL